jgi:hypothetical protein
VARYTLHLQLLYEVSVILASCNVLLTKTTNRAKAESEYPECITVHPYTPGTGNTNMRKHLVQVHLEEWINECDARGIPVTAGCAFDPAKAYRQQNNRPDPTVAVEFSAFSIEGLADSLMELIVKDDLVSSPDPAGLLTFDTHEFS